ncbi:DUF2510 domain-containing protein [Nakamurella antarctica]|uniref:DUF2510 domain-containing protein n=1 Tax=Nakamurella antarctica TaxID=1902245 RepID=A0A3G8ZIY7_9ACTN|nr:DUF2510 domain-containing protein [Nakamurella antarctica]AZI57158.1 DUF2510 domain-containing protein [Nakamurella antarctica]
MTQFVPEIGNASSTKAPKGVGFAAAVSACFGVVYFAIGMYVILASSAALAATRRLGAFRVDLLGDKGTGIILLAIVAVTLGLTLVWGSFLAQGRSTPVPAIVGLGITTVLLFIAVVEIHPLMLLPMALPIAAILTVTRPLARQFFQGDRVDRPALQRDHVDQPTIEGAWHADPMGQAQYRWFDGEKWTEHVR